MGQIPGNSARILDYVKDPVSFAKIQSVLMTLTLESPASRLLNRDRSPVFVDFISKIRAQESN
jgi:hypothetical protein